VLLAAAGAVAGEHAPAKKPPPDVYQRTYAGYRPSFLDLLAPGSSVRDRSLIVDADTMKLSGEKRFFSLTILSEYDRVNAIVGAALQREAKGEIRGAMKLYQLAIERYCRTVRRVSAAGVFVTVGQYCQRRILQLPAADLAFYRTTYDGRAREAMEQARRRYSLAGFQEIVDTMLATSWGDNALAALGDAALDAADYEEALQRYRTVRTLFAGSDSDTPALAMKVALCLKKLGRPPDAEQGDAPAGRDLSADDLARLKKAVDDAVADGVPPDEQRACPPYLTASDYVRFEPPADDMALREPTWSVPLAGARGDHYVFTQPVIADNSVLYRHKNIVYCRSVLNGQLRWIYDAGGRVSWQNPGARMYPMEELVVMDGMVYTNVFKAGPSLVALDLTTGQLRWASGRMAPATRADMRMRYEAAPAIGPRTVYAGYVKDDIEGDTHIDTAYGLRAFDAATGRVLWETEICRLAPGKFTTGVAVAHRNRIRSFTSPSVLHQGILYHNTNAGAIAALNARSGRIEWVMLYPYWPAIHDATRPYGSRPWWLRGPHLPLRPTSWLNQRPLVLGDRVIVAPVDSPCLMSIDRATGKVAWTHGRTGGGHAYMLGPTGTGELILAFSGRSGSVQLLDPKTGKITWKSPDPIKPESSPAMTASRRDIMFAVDIQSPRDHPFWLGARPFLTRDDRLYVQLRLRLAEHVARRMGVQPGELLAEGSPAPRSAAILRRRRPRPRRKAHSRGGAQGPGPREARPETRPPGRHSQRPSAGQRPRLVPAVLADDLRAVRHPVRAADRHADARDVLRPLRRRQGPEGRRRAPRRLCPRRAGARREPLRRRRHAARPLPPSRQPGRPRLPRCGEPGTPSRVAFDLADRHPPGQARQRGRQRPRAVPPIQHRRPRGASPARARRGLRAERRARQRRPLPAERRPLLRTPTVPRARAGAAGPGTYREGRIERARRRGGQGPPRVLHRAGRARHRAAACELAALPQHRQPPASYADHRGRAVGDAAAPGVDGPAA